MEKKYASEYRNEGYLPLPRRLYSSLLDGFLMVVLSFCLLLGSNAIVSALPYYKGEMETINVSRKQMYQIQEETKLFEFASNDDGSKNYDSLLSQNDLFQKYVLSHVLYTYDLNKEEWDSTYTKETDNPYTRQSEYGVSSASYSNDLLAYFFVTYAKSNNENNNLFSLSEGESYESHYKTLLKNNSKGAEWEYYEGSDQLPSLKMSVAYSVYRYTFYNEGGQSGLNSYNYLISQYQGVLEEAENILFNSARYQASYQTYKASYASCSYIVSLFSFISYVVTFLLLIVLPSLLFKDGQTIGIYALKGAIINKEGLEASKKEILIRTIYCFFSCFPVMLFSCFFAGGLNSGWMYPLFTIAGQGVSLFNITVISFIFPIANFITSLIRGDRRGLGELMSQTLIIDKRYYQDHSSIQEKEETKEQERKETEKVILDTPYFDSTSFNNTERKNVFPDEENKEES